jgi:hypothetical protein
MTTMIECTEGHYEVQKTSYGEAYVWRPGYVVVECDCGERAVLSPSEAICRCGADHETLVTELASGRSSEGVPHPWEAEYQEWREKQHEYLFAEETYWSEWKVIE